MCEVLRIDAKNNNASVSQNLGILLEDDTNAYVFWSARDPAYYNTAFHNAEVWVRPIIKETLALGPATQIDINNVVGGEAPWDWDGVAVCKLDSGVMLAAYGTATNGTGDAVRVKESAANDATSWGSRAVVTSGNACLGGLGTDGTNVWLIYQNNNTNDLYLYKRTAANTWAAAATALGSGKIHDAAGVAASPWYDVRASGRERSTPMRVISMQDANVGCIVLAYSASGNVQNQIRCLYTTNGWATTSESVVKDYTASLDTILTGPSIKVIKDEDGKLWAFWIEDNDALGKFVPVIATSIDMGANWTVLGTPTPFTLYDDWDETFDGAFAFDGDGNIYCSMFDTLDGSNIKHRMYKYTGGAFLTDWEMTVCEHIELTAIANVANSTYGDAFINSRGDFVRILNGVTLSGGAFFTVNYLIEEGVFIPETPPPPLIEESPSGSDAANVYLRNRLAEQRNWSAHDLGVSAWAAWPEGDYTTQRRKPILLAGMSTIDPSVTDPRLLGAIYKLDDPAHLGREVWTEGADGSTVARNDPFTFEWWSKAFTLTENWMLVRGYIFRYRRPTLPVTVEVWVNGRIAQTDVFDPTGPDDGSRDIAALSDPVFMPFDPIDNLGDTVQLRVIDETLDDLTIEECKIVYIDKGRRG